MERVEYKDWLLPEPSDNTKAKCRFCKRSFFSVQYGRASYKKSWPGKEASECCKGNWEKYISIGLFEEGASTSKQSEELSACKESEELSAAVTRSNEEQKSSTMAKFALTKGQHKAEILWALKSVMSHFSYNSAHDITDVFKAMFPDSSIAQHMSCSPTKLSYMISFGIAPYSWNCYWLK